MNSEKMYFTWDDYTKAIKTLENTLNQWGVTKPHFVSIYRGSLVIGQHLSNIFNAPLSIIKYQTLDGNDKSPEFMYNAGIKKDEVVVVLDDIFDTGKTMSEVLIFLDKNYADNRFIAYTLTGNNKIKQLPDWVTYDTDTDGKWVVFPWEQ